MPYVPHTQEDICEMLSVAGFTTLDEMFESIPKQAKLSRSLDLPSSLDEQTLYKLLRFLSAQNTGLADRVAFFLGAGVYSHYVPAVVDAITARGEFFTAYTPYQPEVSQGTLQAMFEYQTMIASLLGTEIANASMYDGASATAEATLMAQRIKRKRNRTLLSTTVHPEVRNTCLTYLSEFESHPKEIPFTSNGTTDLDVLSRCLDEKIACVVIQQPNVFGCIEPLDEITRIVHNAGALLIVVVLEPISLGLLKPPGKFGADIVVGEGMSFGCKLYFGGPGLGLFGTSRKNMWQMPGRLVGETLDNRGVRGYVLTLAAREQHIRRERSTSNICTNTGLCALAATVFLSLMGKKGFTELSRINIANAHYTLKRLQRVKGITRAFAAPFYNEFVLEVDACVQDIIKELAKQEIVAGFDLQRFYPQLCNHLLVCVTECNTRDQVEHYAKCLEGLLT